MNILVRAAAMAGLAMLPLTGATSAHTSYLLPNFFSVTDAKMVTIESSFAEKFFQPEVVVKSQDFHLYRPDGRRDSFKKIASFEQVTILENDLTEPGTYLFTTGERLGRIATLAKVKGKWEMVNPEDPTAKVPADATETTTLQTATVADVYVTKGAPTKNVLSKTPGRLAITPITHPNAIFLEDAFDLALSYGGKPLPGQEMVLYRQGGAYDEKAFEKFYKTDAAGKLSLKFDQPGVYLLMTRYRGDSPPGAATPLRSYTSSLTFEVTR